MLYRLRSDFQLSIIVLFAAAATICVLPLGMYCLLTGSIGAGVANCAVVVAFCSAALYAWRTGDTRRAGWFVVAFGISLGIVMTHVLGQSGLFGIFTLLLASFLMVDRKIAAAIAAFTVLVVLVDGKAFSSSNQSIAFAVNGALLSLLAFLFATRAEVQRLQLESLATHDALTGLHNRRAMQLELRIAVETYQRSRVRFGLVMLDLDHFKRINDAYGHEAGDRVLVAFAEILRRSTRKVDRVFRYGGEEFVMLLAGVDISGLRTVTSNLRTRIDAALCGPGGKVTTSLGAALLIPNEDEHCWLARADAALYEAKANGRDRAVIDERVEPGV